MHVKVLLFHLSEVRFQLNVLRIDATKELFLLKTLLLCIKTLHIRP